MDLVTRLRYRSSTDLYPTDTALTLMAAAADEITQLRGNLSLAEEGLANYAQEDERLRTALVGAYSLWSRDQGDGCETANKMADIINAALESLHEPTADKT